MLLLKCFSSPQASHPGQWKINSLWIKCLSFWDNNRLAKVRFFLELAKVFHFFLESHLADIQQTKLSCGERISARTTLYDAAFIGQCHHRRPSKLHWERNGKEKEISTDKVLGEFRGHAHPLPCFMEPCIQFIPIQVLSYKILQVHYPVVPYFKLQYIVFVVQHGQMDVFLNTFLIGIIRQLLISPIPRDDGILARNHCKVDNAAVITQHFKGITRFQYPGNIRDFGHIMT